ncbi:MAG: hypothetical protein CVV02_01560 [Firmicutes bacterium HGW-Firmicutes-7]|nr:MAG: hypothetical protein CVV02_01560 [Firmicutes bacterium HGW-Firmicutes-7]
MIRKLREKKGEGYIDIAVFVIVAVMVIAFVVKLFPVFIVKDQLNNLADQILREAEIQGMIYIDYSQIKNSSGITPDEVTWDASSYSSNKVQLNDPITVTCTAKVDIGLFGDFASFPINLKGKATGRSEVFWK